MKDAAGVDPRSSTHLHCLAAEGMRLPQIVFRDYQQSAGMTVDGIVGSKTVAALMDREE